VTVVGCYEGKNRLTGSLGGFIVKGTVTYKKKQYEILSRCGGGFKDSERDAFWAQYKDGKKLDNNIIEITSGLVIEARYQDVTTAICASSVNNQPSLRFPRFRRTRLDKMPVEAGGR
jgi:ATP-dependent DNA ligase